MEKNNECKEFEELKKELDFLLTSIKKDAEEFFNKENKAAGIRLRKGLKIMKTYVQDVINSTLPKNQTK